MIDESYREFAKTPVQSNYLTAVIKYGSNNKASKQLGVSRRSVDASINRIKKAYEKYHGLNSHGDLATTGTSTLERVPDDPDVLVRWVKRNKSAQKQLEAMRIAIDEMKEDIEPCKPEPAPGLKLPDQLLNQFTLTDYHLGMKCWGEECGQDWDLEIAEDLLVKWFVYAIETAPKAKTALLAQLGDFLHWDGLEAVTPTARNILDADTRFQKVVRVAIRVLRRIIQMLLLTHGHVHLVMAEGNHDPASSAWLRECLAALYDNEPRLTIDVSPNPYYCYQHGRTALFYHHGHKRNMSTIDRVFVGMFREEYGNTDHAYAHTGHFHHLKAIESELMEVEQHPTLASNDAYNARAGYISGRSAKRITYHKEYGWSGSEKITPEMLV